MHPLGIRHVKPRLALQGDARYLISNSKDQSIKLWDIRKFSPKEGLAASRLAVTQQNWDYRWQQVPQRGEERGRKMGGGRGGGVEEEEGSGGGRGRTRSAPVFAVNQVYRPVVCVSPVVAVPVTSAEEAQAGWRHLGDDVPRPRRPAHPHPLPLLTRVQHRTQVHLLRLLHRQDHQ